MLRPLYPGQLHAIRKNVHHAVFVLDLSRKEDLTQLVEEITTLIQRQIPIRFGVVPLATETDDSATVAKIFYRLVNTYGRAVAIKFAEDLLEAYDPAALSTKMKSLYSTVYSKSKPLPGQEKIPYDDLIKNMDIISKARSWANRLGVNPKEGAIFGNGQVFVKDDAWANSLGTALHEDVLLLQKGVYSADISDDDNILDYLFRDAPKSRNEYIFPVQSGNVKFINLPEILNENVVYIHGELKDSLGVENATVIWVVDDFDSFKGVELVKAAAAFQAAHPEVTIGLVHNPGSTTGPPNLSLLIYYLATNGFLDDAAGIEKFRQLVQEVDLANQDTSEVDKVLGIKAQSWRIVDSENARMFWDDSRSFARAAGFVEGERGIIINGRVLSKLTFADEGNWTNSRRS